MSAAPLYPAAPWKAHRFPHKRIVRRVLKAKGSYRCEIQGSPPPDHSPAIPSGSTYLRVSLLPDRSGSTRFRNVKLCPACAIHLGLATTEPPKSKALI